MRVYCSEIDERKVALTIERDAIQPVIIEPDTREHIRKLLSEIKNAPPVEVKPKRGRPRKPVKNNVEHAEEPQQEPESINRYELRNRKI